MIEHREPPRIAAGDGQLDGTAGEPGGSLRLRAFDPAGMHRPHVFRRAGLVALAAVAVAAGLIYLAFRATRAGVEWLHRQTEYELAFNDIRLAPEPPGWYRGGSREFLERVRGGVAGESERISRLDVGPERLAVAFKNYAWVDHVVKVAYGPGRIVVNLQYHRPVAIVDLPDGQQRLIDDKGIILPPEDIDMERLGPLIRITGKGLSPPCDPQAGTVWKSKTSGTELGMADPRIQAAAKLAGFVQSKTSDRESESSPALRFREINVAEIERSASFGLFLIAERAPIWWGSAPGDEGPGKLSADEKWAMVVLWQRTTRARFVPEGVEGDFWRFSRAGLYYYCCHDRNSPHKPTEILETGKERRGAVAQPDRSG